MKGKSKIQLALWTLLFMVAIPISAYGVDGQIKIAQTAATTFPIQINESGSYVLTSNLTVTTANVKAINIYADNVTLDLNGHGIYGPGTGYGISAVNCYNITIKNGIVRGFHFGIYLENDGGHKGAGYRIEGIQASNNDCHGIYASYSTVTNCTANDNRFDGIYAWHSTVTNCTAGENGEDGIYAPYSSTVINCTAYNNGSYGICAYFSTVTNCTANYNDSDGIYASYSTVTNCTAYNNGSYGICVIDNTVTNCTANYNGSYGIYAGHSTVTNCTANYNDSDGIYARRSTVKGCNVRYNTGYGINMGTNYSNYIYRNAASGNTIGQINCPSGNTCVDNATF